jgi:hypothetical protein
VVRRQECRRSDGNDGSVACMYAQLVATTTTLKCDISKGFVLFANEIIIKYCIKRTCFAISCKKYKKDKKKETTNK